MVGANGIAQRAEFGPHALEMSRGPEDRLEVRLRALRARTRVEDRTAFRESRDCRVEGGGLEDLRRHGRSLRPAEHPKRPVVLAENQRELSPGHFIREQQRYFAYNADFAWVDGLGEAKHTTHLVFAYLLSRRRLPRKYRIPELGALQNRLLRQVAQDERRLVSLADLPGILLETRQVRQLVEDVPERRQRLHGRFQVVETVAPADHRLKLSGKVLHAQKLETGARRRAHETLHLVLVHEAVELRGHFAETRP